jgi:hypothetical protein
MRALVASPRSRVSIALAIVLAAGLLFVSPMARVLGSQLLQGFRVQRFVAISFDPSQASQGVRALPDLSQLGTVTEISHGRMRAAASAEEAGNLAGMPVRLPAASAVTADPQFMVIEPASMSFTFDVERAREHLAAAGQASFRIPDEFDGAVLTASIPAVVVAQYGGRPGRFAPGPEMFNPDSLVLIEGRSPTARVSGRVSLTDMRQLLLSMPGLPPETVAQLQAIDDWTTTLPIPVPRNIGVAHDVQVNGRPGLAIADNTGAGGVILWTQGGIVYAVGGGKTADELLAIASTLA